MKKIFGIIIFIISIVGVSHTLPPKPKTDTLIPKHCISLGIFPLILLQPLELNYEYSLLPQLGIRLKLEHSFASHKNNSGVGIPARYYFLEPAFGLYLGLGPHYTYYDNIEQNIDYDYMIRHYFKIKAEIGYKVNLGKKNWGVYIEPMINYSYMYFKQDMNIDNQLDREYWNWGWVEYDVRVGFYF